MERERNEGNVSHITFRRSWKRASVFRRILKPVQLLVVIFSAGFLSAQWLSASISQPGALYVWGDNGSGELGDGTRTVRSMPLGITGLSSGVTAVASGGGHSLAVQNGAVYSWGLNYHGQLGAEDPLPLRVRVRDQGKNASMIEKSSSSCVVPRRDWT